MQYFGNIYLRITSGNGAYPLENATVLFVGTSEQIKNERMSSFSNADGVTPTMSVKTPSPELTASPMTAEKGYSELNVTVTAEGYYKKSVFNVSVYPGITTELPVNMTPVSRYDAANNVPKDYDVVLE